MPPGLYSLAKYQAYLARLLTRPGSVNSFESLKRELYIPAVHLDSGDRVLFGSSEWRDGGISDANPAPAAPPLLFQPVTIPHRDFLDVAAGGAAHLRLP